MTRSNRSSTKQRSRRNKSTRCIRVWRFQDAPLKYQRLSRNGGDEDWIAVVPAEIYEKIYITWLDVPCFGACNVEEHDIPGYKVVIGCHA